MRIEKIYSRRKIKFPKSKFNKPKIIALSAIILILIAIFSFIFFSYPIFESSCKTSAYSKAITIVNDVVENVMNEYSYNDFVNLEKNESGDIVYVESNVININKIIAKIAKNIQYQIDNLPTTNVHINYGTISGISFFKTVGPKFNIELETSGKISTNLESEFESVGVNQTIHKIYLNLNMNVGILTPLGSFSNSVDDKILLTESIIVGKIPDAYYNLEGIEQADTLKVGK